MDCTSLTSVTLGSNIREIGTTAFANTPKLETITYNGTLEQWGRIHKESDWITPSETAKLICTNGEYLLKDRIQ